MYAVERKADAVELMQENCAQLFVPNVNVVRGTAPEALRALPAPTHVFLGGSGGNLREIMEQAMEKNPHVRMVVTAIALESVAEMTALAKEMHFTEFEAVCVNIARGRRAGNYHLMTGQNPIYIFTCQA